MSIGVIAPTNGGINCKKPNSILHISIVDFTLIGQLPAYDCHGEPGIADCVFVIRNRKQPNNVFTVDISIIGYFIIIRPCI